MTLHEARRTFADASSISELQGELRAAELAIRRGDVEDGVAQLLELTNDFHYAGLSRLVDALVSDIRTLTSRSATPPHQEGWILNYESIAASDLGDPERAMAILERMLAIGREIGDSQLISTALQNLSIQADKSGDHKTAIRQAREAMRLKLQLGDYFAATQIVSNIGSALFSAGHGDEAEALLDKFGFLFDELKVPGLHASRFGILGQVQASRGEFDDAEGSLKRSLAYARRSGDVQKEVTALTNLAALELDRGRPGKAARWFRAAIRRAEVSNLPPQLEGLYRGLAVALHRTGRTREAIKSLETARRQARKLEDRRLWAGATVDLGALWVSAGDPKRAARLLTNAVKAYRDVGDVEGCVNALRNLSAAYRDQQKYSAGRRALEEAIGLAALPEEQAQLNRELAELASLENDVASVVTALDREQEALKSVGRRERAWSARMSAALLRDIGAHAEALGFCDTAVRLYTQIRDPQQAADARNDRAIALADLGRRREALRDLRVGQRTARRLEDRVLELQATMNIGEVLRRDDRADEAVESLNSALELARSLEDPESEGDVLVLIGLALDDLGQVDDATATFRAARQIARSAHHASTEAAAVKGLAHIDLESGRYRRAAQNYARATELGPFGNQQTLEAYAGWLISLSAADAESGLEEVAQQLVDLAQARGAESLASDAFTKAAARLLDHNRRDEAQRFYAVAILLGAMDGWRPGATIDPAANAESLLLQVMVMFEHLLQRHEDVEAFAADVWKVLDREYRGLGRRLKVALDVSLEAYASRLTSGAD